MKRLANCMALSVKCFGQKRDFFADAVGAGFEVEQFGQLVGAEFFDGVEGVFAIYGGDVERVAVDVFAGNGQAFKFAQGSAADVGQFVDVVGADVEHGGLFFLREGVQTDGENHQFARAAGCLVMARRVGIETRGGRLVNLAHMVAIGVVVSFARVLRDVFSLIMMALKIGQDFFGRVAQSMPKWLTSSSLPSSLIWANSAISV